MYSTTMGCQHLECIEKEKAVNVLKAFAVTIKPSMNSKKCLTRHPIYTEQNFECRSMESLQTNERSLENRKSLQALNCPCHIINTPEVKIGIDYTELFDHNGSEYSTTSTETECHDIPLKTEFNNISTSSFKDIPCQQSNDRPKQSIFAPLYNPAVASVAEMNPACQCRECVSFGAFHYSALMICLDCVHVSCLRHCQSHAHETGHSFFLGLEHHYIYCCKCNDFVYNELMEIAIDVGRLVLHGSSYSFLCYVTKYKNKFLLFVFNIASVDVFIFILFF